MIGNRMRVFVIAFCQRIFSFHFAVHKAIEQINAIMGGDTSRKKMIQEGVGGDSIKGANTHTNPQTGTKQSTHN